jgi:DNA-binding NtrC family response regulator
MPRCVIYYQLGREMNTSNSASPFSNIEIVAPTILIAEDICVIRNATASYLRACGLQVIEAVSADEAILYLQTTLTIDLVFSDVQMPGEQDGLGLARWVRTSRPGLPVLLTSGDFTKADAAKELCGNGSFFAKPYNVEYLEAHIRSRIENRRAD